MINSSQTYKTSNIDLKHLFMVLLLYIILSRAFYLPEERYRQQQVN